MEITQYFISSLCKDTISALDEKVVIHHKDIFLDLRFEHYYRDISISTEKGKTGESGWTTTAFYVFILTSVIETLAHYFLDINTLSIYAIGIILSLIVFSLRFLKYDFINFCTVSGNSAFHIKLSGKDRQHREEFVNYVLEKIKNANS